MQIITKEQAEDIRSREKAINDYRGKRNWLAADELKNAGIPDVTNDERSALETFEFVTAPPDKYFLYISEKENKATTWTGDTLGRVSFGSAYSSAFGDVRVPVWIDAINGKRYFGTYFKSAGDYARIKALR